MIIIKRTVEGDVALREHRNTAQAAINSDGNITIRGYNTNDPLNEDETMLVLDKPETKAVFDLMREIANLTKYGLPF